MNKEEQNEIIDLGVATIETGGLQASGIADGPGQQKHFVGGGIADD